MTKLTQTFLAISFAAAACVSANAQSWADPESWQQAKPAHEIKAVPYAPPGSPDAEPAMQVVDIYQNGAAGKRPVLVYMHGGGWIRGQRPAGYGGFRAWLAAGFTVVNVEYRLDVPAPAALQDVRCVLSFIEHHAAEYSFDTSRVVTYGTSAGGHLALLAAILPAKNDMDLPACKDQPHIAAVLDFYGPYHLEAGTIGVFASPSVKKWLRASPMPSFDAELHALSPSTYIRKAMPPVFQAHGDADPTVPFAASVELRKDLDAAGVPNVLDTVPGGGHGGWTAEENRRVQLDSLRCLQAHGIVP